MVVVIDDRKQSHIIVKADLLLFYELFSKLAGAGRSSPSPIGHENQVKKVGVMQRGFGSGIEKNQET